MQSRENRMSPAARDWLERITNGLLDLFLAADTNEKLDVAVEAFTEVRRLWMATI